MEPLQFAYWLQGYFEVAEPNTLGEKEIHIIRQHLDLVFNKVTEGYTLSPTTFTNEASCGIFYLPEMDCDEEPLASESLELNTYRYSALNADGWTIWGTIDAVSDIDAIQKLRESDIYPYGITGNGVANNQTSKTTYC